MPGPRHPALGLSYAEAQRIYRETLAEMKLPVVNFR